VRPPSVYGTRPRRGRAAADDSTSRELEWHPPKRVKGKGPAARLATLASAEVVYDETFTTAAVTNNPMGLFVTVDRVGHRRGPHPQ
jgi:type IV secretory pathway TrbF-like protein